jgi:hypothetical protein
MTPPLAPGEILSVVILSWKMRDDSCTSELEYRRRDLNPHVLSGPRLAEEPQLSIAPQAVASASFATPARLKVYFGVF